MRSTTADETLTTMPPQPRARSFAPDGWTVAALIVAALVALPAIVVAAQVFLPSGGVWAHLAETVLWRYVVNTVILVLSVGTGTLLLGVGAAWLTSMCKFPCRRMFEWAILLPLAMPAYVMAYAYTDFLQFSGPVQTWLREAFEWGPRDYWFPQIRSVGGAAAMLTLVLYPYVYLVARTAFLEQSVCVIEVSRALGCGPVASFRRVVLPLARPGIVAGLSLVLMETLADFGTVAFFGVQTFTTGIYKAWFSLGSPIAAAQLSTVLLGFVLVVMVTERRSRGPARYHHTSNRYQRIVPHRLPGGLAWLATAACFVPITLGFILPAGILLNMALGDPDVQMGQAVFGPARNSLLLGAVAAGIAVLVAVLLGYAARARPSRIVRGACRVAGLGYAVPGTVIAVGLLLPLTAFDNAVDAWMRATLGISTGLLLTGSIVALVYAYVVRFLAVSFNTVEASLAKIRPSLDEAARCLGERPIGMVRRVHAPLMWTSLLAAGLLVCVDVMKELPATLIMRPFNFDTLAVQAHNLAADERLSQAAVPALLLVGVGLLPIIVLSRQIYRSRPGKRRRVRF